MNDSPQVTFLVSGRAGFPPCRWCGACDGSRGDTALQHHFFSLFILYYGHLFKLIGKDILHSFPRLQNAVINYRMPVSVGSGEVLNDTVEGIHSMDGAPVTDVGSGDGSFIQVTEEVSEW